MDACIDQHTMGVAVVGRGPGVILVCVRCGSYAETLPRGLAGPCRVERGGPTAGKRRFLRRLAQGWHPKDDVPVGPVWPLSALRGGDACSVPWAGVGA